MRRVIYNIIKTTRIKSLDSVVSWLAPNACFGCGGLGSCLCGVCLDLAVSPPPSRCFRCQRVSDEYLTCSSCRNIIHLRSLLSAGPYDGIHKQLVLKMKKDGSREAATSIAEALALLLAQNSYLLRDIDLIVPVPTIRPHIRERGFDHTRTIAQELSRLIGLPTEVLLERITNTRQVGKSKKERFAQMENGVKLRRVKRLNGVKILLIDDIATTGATLSACSRELKKAGATSVSAVVFAAGNS